MEYIPFCEEKSNSKFDKVFPTLEHGLKYCKDYANTCGFVCVLGSEKKIKGIIMFKYCFCNKQGKKIEKKASLFRKRF